MRFRASVRYADYEIARARKRVRSERLQAARARVQHQHNDLQWKALLEFCGSRCVKCGREGHQDRDHIIPLYLGGCDCIGNIQPLCAWCNSSKTGDCTDYRPLGWSAMVAR